MAIYEQINTDIKEAMKAKRKEELDVLRFLKSAVKDVMINEKKDITDEVVIGIIAKQVKQSKDSMTEYEKGGREELAAKEKNSIEILSKYLPEQLDEAEAEKIVKDILNKEGITSKQDMGKAMQAVMVELKGKVEGRLINQLVMRNLS